MKNFRMRHLHFLYILFFSCFFLNDISSQCYQNLGNKNGIAFENIQSKVETASCELKEELVGYVDVSIFDFGLYLFNGENPGQVDATVTKLKTTAESLNPNYIFFLRVSTSSEFNYKTICVVGLDSTVSPCLTPKRVEEMETKINNNFSITVDGDISIQINRTLEYLKIALFKSIGCCGSRIDECSNENLYNFVEYYTLNNDFDAYIKNLLEEIEFYTNLWQCVTDCNSDPDKAHKTFPDIYTGERNACVGEVGVVPKCWVDCTLPANMPDFYKHQFAGFYDGIYLGIESLITLVKDIPSILLAYQDVHYAFIGAFVFCHEGPYQFNLELCDSYVDYIISKENRTEAENVFLEFFLVVQETYTEFQIDMISFYLDDCDSAANLRQEIVDFLTNWKQMRILIEQIVEVITTYAVSYTTTDVPGYCLGKARGIILAEIIGEKGIGAMIKVAKNLGKNIIIIHDLMKQFPGQADELAELSKLEADGVNIKYTLGDLPSQLVKDFPDKDILRKFMDGRLSVKAWEDLFDFPNLRIKTNHLEAYDVFKTSNNVTPKVTKDEIIEVLEELGSEADQIKYLEHLDEFNKGNRQWGHVDYTGGTFNGNSQATFFDVRVSYQANRPQVGVAFSENGILEMHLLIPSNLQQQKLGTNIFKRAIIDYNPSKVKGNWKTANVYDGGESINLTIFKQKLADGLTPQAAAFETPTGKILKQNGFGGTPTIITNTADEVVVHFNPG